MQDLNQKQKQILAESLSQLGVAVIVIGIINPLFTTSVSLVELIIKGGVSVLIGISLILISIRIFKKKYDST